MKHSTNTHTTTDRLRALAEGPALDLPPVQWEAPAEVDGEDGRAPSARWGVLPWESDDSAWVPNVYLCAYDIRGLDGPFIEVGEERYTLAQARVLLDRLASAIAMAEEVTR